MRELRRTMSGARPEVRGRWRRRPRAKSRVRMQDLRSGDAAGGHEVDGGEGGGEAARGGETEEAVLERLKVVLVPTHCPPHRQWSAARVVLHTRVVSTC